jgi:hypothetical protein
MSCEFVSPLFAGHTLRKVHGADETKRWTSWYSDIAADQDISSNYHVGLELSAWYWMIMGHDRIMDAARAWNFYT